MNSRLAVLLSTITVAALGLVACGSSGNSSDNPKIGGGATSTANSGATSAAPSRSATIKIASFLFKPKTVTIAAGGKVTWTNFDAAPHTASAKDEAARSTFDTQTLKKGQSKTLTFAKAGTYPYLCLFHPFMVGTVVVK